jgi:hypothetical protein
MLKKKARSNRDDNNHNHDDGDDDDDKRQFYKVKKKDEIRVQNLGLLVSQLTHGSNPRYLSEPFCSLCSQNNCCSWMFIPPNCCIP